MEAAREGWNWGARKARCDGWATGRVMICWSCVGSPIRRGGMVVMACDVWVGGSWVLLEIFEVAE